MILYAASADRSLEVAKLSLGECSVYGRSDRDVLVYLCWICCGLLCGRGSVGVLWRWYVVWL